MKKEIAALLAGLTFFAISVVIYREVPDSPSWFILFLASIGSIIVLYHYWRLSNE